MKSIMNIMTVIVALLSTNFYSISAQKNQAQNELSAVFAKYFEIKDALVSTDGKSAALKAKELTDAIKNVSMEKLTAELPIITARSG